MKKQIKINPRLLLAISKWADQHGERLHLNVVRFADDRVIATDGHRAVLFPTTTHGFSFGIRPREISAIAAAHREIDAQGHVAISIDTSVDGVFFADVSIGASATLRVRAHGVADYPSVAAIIPKTADTPVPGHFIFDAGYLAAIDEVHRETPSYTKSGLTITAWSVLPADGICGPMLFEGVDGIKFIVMPMRKP